jgi:Cys/Met metabolism PLP-dependent enzyme
VGVAGLLTALAVCTLEGRRAAMSSEHWPCSCPKRCPDTQRWAPFLLDLGCVAVPRSRRVQPNGCVAPTTSWVCTAWWPATTAAKRGGVSHAGSKAQGWRVERALCWPGTRRDTAELIAYQEGRYGSYEYGRYGNPTTRAVEEKIRALEGAEDCLVSSSGMNSATTMLLALVPAGGHIVTTTDCYRRTRQVRCPGARGRQLDLMG